MPAIGVEIDRILAKLGYRDQAFAARYDKYRPRPPGALLELLPRIAGITTPALVVDIGAGTGLSTRFWADNAVAVIGIDPSPEMLRQAEHATECSNVRYILGTSSATTLPGECADIVTCSQSLQWMEPKPTFAEVSRILRPGGVFAAYAYEGGVTTSWAFDATFIHTRATAIELRNQRNLDVGRKVWPVSRKRLQESGIFRFTDEVALHSVEQANAERLMGFLMSEGIIVTLLEQVPEEEIGLPELRKAAEQEIGPTPSAWHLGYRLWYGVR